MASRPLAARVAALPLRWFGIGAGVLALGVSGFAGGLDPVATPGPPQVQPSAAVDAGPVKVTVLVGRVVNDLSPIKPSKDGDRWFMVIATIEVTANDSRVTPEPLRVPHVAGLLNEKPDRVLLSRDATDVDYLNPGMPEKVAYLWEQRPDVPVPATADVEILGETYRTNSLTGGMEWLPDDGDHQPRATVHVPVQDKRT
jgi:hypothetical protein